jgi:hypothetical protein
MAWKPKTIFGKIIKGAGSALLPIAGAVTGIGAITGIGKGIGVLAGVGGAVKTSSGTVKKVIDTVGAKAVDLVTGTTKAERLQVQEQKALTKAEKDKYEQVDRLIKAGATKEAAFSKVGVSFAEEQNINDALSTSGTIAESPFNNPVIKYGAMALGAFMLAKILKIVK